MRIKLKNLGWALGAQGASGGNPGQKRSGLNRGMVRVGLLTLSHYGVLVFSVHGALEVVDDALERQSEALLEALQDPVLTLQGSEERLCWTGTWNS